MPPPAPACPRYGLLALLALACTSERLAVGQCEFDRDCADGQLCVDQYCRPPCRTDSDCPNGRCVATDTPGGRACRPNAVNAPACTRDSDCEPGQACFDGRCLAQCRQDYDCRVVNPSASCVRGRCVVSCPALRGDCDGNPANGCETDLLTSPSHCSACGNVCPNAPRSTPACTAGRCALTCERGFADCDGNPANGCEADLSSPDHCGMCGRRCTAPTPRCAPSAGGWACAAEPCPSTLCSGMCVDTQTDVNHCGACNTRCPQGPNATASCVGGACRLACDIGFGDCDGMPTNGCETALRSTALHCGRCGNACPERENARVFCSSGRCEFVCTMGFADCDGMPANGCEIDLTSDTAHCGTCGRACPVEWECVEGRCVLPK